jgi:thiamine pyrophosphate-dependent acetolactate synthase large subunit-like protein
VFFLPTPPPRRRAGPPARPPAGAPPPPGPRGGAPPRAPPGPPPPYRPYHEALQQVLPPDTVIAGDSAQASYFGTVHQWPCQRPGQFVYPAGYATLGYGIPAGIGAAIAAPDTPVVVLAGDGGTLFTIQELLTAVDLRLGLPVVVMNNGGYGEIRDEMDQRGIPRQSVDLRSPDFPALGRAFGGEGVRAHEPDEVAREVAAALRRDVPTLIEVPLAS